MDARADSQKTQADSAPFKAWHAFLWFAGFFGVMFAVNGIFLWTAITTFPGEDVKKSYLTGLTYNAELDRRAHQTEAGWNAGIGVSGSGAQRQFTIRLMTKDRDALPAGAVTLDIRHPADRARDRTIALVPLGAGEYAADAADFAPGIWTVILTADIDPETAGHEFRATREVYLP